MRAVSRGWPRLGRVTGRDGLFIAFEGGDGAGKSTQVRLLAEVLRARGRVVTVTRQPGGTELGVAIRDLVLHGDHVSPRAEALLFAADKAHHVDELVRPALERGEVVVTDRYTDSSVAYQGAGRDLGAAEVHDLQMWAVDGLVPDLTVVVDVTAAEGRRRRGGTHDRLESEEDTFHEAIRQHFLSMAAGHPERYLVVDGAERPEHLHGLVMDRLEAMGLVDPMTVWRDVIGQERAVATLEHAVRSPEAMTHAWLFTGPPGSGRSVAARAFAAALLCPQGGCGECRECRTALEATHADVDVVATEGLSIKVEQARDLVQLAAHRPSVGRYRVIVVEDADRLTERAADALLKALEEPSPRTVWMLCAPSLEDVIITIRSRSRHVRLRTPSVDAVADLLTRRDGVDPSMALYAARAAQCHVGLARRLARDEHARIRRHDVITLSTKIVGVGEAIGAASDIMTIATEEAAAASGERDAAERARLLEVLGADTTARTQPPHVRAQVTSLEKEQKARATRFTRDVVDRALVDLLSVYRDALVIRAGAGTALVNEDSRQVVQRVADVLGPDDLLGAMDAIGTARERIGANVNPLLALEAMALDLRLPR